MTYGTLTLAALTSLALCAGPSHAAVGVKAGVNVASLTTDTNLKDPSSVTGLTGGVFMSIGLGPIAIEPDILFTAKGASYDAAIGTTVLKVVDHYNYIEVPVLLKWMIIPAGPVQPYLGAGPAVSFLMSAKSKQDLAGATTTVDVKKSLASSEYSAVIEAGLAINLVVTTISLDVRYGLGLSNVYKTQNGTTIDTKNRVISILAGVSF